MEQAPKIVSITPAPSHVLHSPRKADLFDSHLAKVFANGISVPVDPDGRIQHHRELARDLRRRSSSAQRSVQQLTMPYSSYHSRSSRARSIERGGSRSGGHPPEVQNFQAQQYITSSVHNRDRSWHAHSMPSLPYKEDVYNGYRNVQHQNATAYDAYADCRLRQRSNGRSRSTERRSRPQSYDHSRSHEEDIAQPGELPIHHDGPVEDPRQSNLLYSEPPSDDSNDRSLGKKRKPKMEKIQELKAKNDLYKEEFKRVQKDRKKLKKEVEYKKSEIASLTNEIDSHIEETSVLKRKLSEALQELDRTDLSSRKDKSNLVRVNKELVESREELDALRTRIKELNNDIATLHDAVKRKDAQIDSLTTEVTEQTGLIEALRNENRLEANGNQYLFTRINEEKIQGLLEENKNIQKELGSTLERAAAMVKDREDAIADLLKENDEIKKQLLGNCQAQELRPMVSADDLEELKDNLDNTHRALEEAQDRNLVLEEEIEGWLARGGSMESEMVRLRDEVLSWKQKAAASQDSVAIVETSAEEAMVEAQAARKALAELEEIHANSLARAEIQHKAAMSKAEERLMEALMEAKKANDRAENAKLATERLETDTSNCENMPHQVEPSDDHARQAMLLEQAVAYRRSKTGVANKKGWFSGLGINDEEELTEDQKRIKELEAINTDQNEEIQKLKSELVRLRSSYNEATYTTKKKIERLEHENEAYSLKVSALEQASNDMEETTTYNVAN